MCFSQPSDVKVDIQIKRGYWGSSQAMLVVNFRSKLLMASLEIGKNNNFNDYTRCSLAILKQRCVPAYTEKGSMIVLKTNC